MHNVGDSKPLPAENPQREILFLFRFFCILQSNCWLVLGQNLKYNCRRLGDWQVCLVGRSRCGTTVAPTVRQRGVVRFCQWRFFFVVVVVSHPSKPVVGSVLSGKVHGAQGVLVDLNSLGQGLLVAPVTLPRCMAALGTEAEKKQQCYVRFPSRERGSSRSVDSRKRSPVVLFVHQVIASSESHQMGVISWRWDGDGPGAAHVGVAQLVGEHLQLIRREVVVVPEHVVMRRPAGALGGGRGNTIRVGNTADPPVAARLSHRPTTLEVVLT